MSVKLPEPAAPRPPADDMMRRLQIGVAGVFAVLLLVGLAGLIGKNAREEATAQVAAGTAIAPAEDPKGGEPLVELGVQPSANPEETVNAAPTEQPLPPGTTVPDLQPDPALERARQTPK